MDRLDLAYRLGYSQARITGPGFPAFHERTTDTTMTYSFDPPLRSPNVKMSGPPEGPARAKK